MIENDKFSKIVILRNYIIFCRLCLVNFECKVCAAIGIDLTT